MIDFLGDGKKAQRQTRMQEMLQKRLFKSAKDLMSESKKELLTVQAIQCDTGYNIINESMIVERQPAEFCMSLPRASIADGLMGDNFNLKEMKINKQKANKETFKCMLAMLKKD